MASLKSGWQKEDDDVECDVWWVGAGRGCRGRFAEAGARCAQIIIHQRRLEQRLCLHYWASLQWAVRGEKKCVCLHHRAHAV